MCRYGPLSKMALESSLLVENRASVEKLARFLNIAGHYDTRAYNCPMDDGRSVDFAFWNQTSRIQVHLGTSGCDASSNGSTFRLFAEAPPGLRNILGLPPG